MSGVHGIVELLDFGHLGIVDLEVHGLAGSFDLVLELLVETLDHVDIGEQVLKQGIE
jgi:hypothetical protein